MAKPMTAAELSARYGELYEAVRSLPSKIGVDVERVLRDYLSAMFMIYKPLLRTIQRGYSLRYKHTSTQFNGQPPRSSLSMTLVEVSTRNLALLSRSLKCLGRNRDWCG